MGKYFESLSLGEHSCENIAPLLGIVLNEKHRQDLYEFSQREILLLWNIKELIIIRERNKENSLKIFGTIHGYLIQFYRIIVKNLQ
jgi:hypothetical protein